MNILLNFKYLDVIYTYILQGVSLEIKVFVMISKDGIDEIINQNRGEFAKTDSEQTTVLTNNQKSKNTKRISSALNYVGKAFEKFEDFAHEHLKEKSIENVKVHSQERTQERTGVDFSSKINSVLDNLGESVHKLESAITRSVEKNLVEHLETVNGIGSPNAPVSVARQRAKTI